MEKREEHESVLCISCMREKKAGEVCPHCGFDGRSYLPPPHHLPPETILNGKYLIGKSLGEGGFGITYVGWDLALEVKVAVKEYYPAGSVARNAASGLSVSAFSGSSASHFQAGRDKFIREARILAKFDSMGEIVRVRDFFIENNTAYIVMEYLDGTTLDRYVEQMGGRLAGGLVLEMLEPVIRALQKIHAAGLIHRDISPDNIMVMPDGRTKLLDFGAARDIALVNSSHSKTVMLKLGYAPEEQYRTHGGQGPWTDVYALCATIYYCMTGCVPPEALERLKEDPLVPPRSLGAALTEAQERALLKGLAVPAEQRYQSMEELYTHLYGGAAEAGAASRREGKSARRGAAPGREASPGQGTAPGYKALPECPVEKASITFSSGKKGGRMILTAVLPPRIPIAKSQLPFLHDRRPECFLPPPAGSEDGAVLRYDVTSRETLSRRLSAGTVKRWQLILLLGGIAGVMEDQRKAKYCGKGILLDPDCIYLEEGGWTPSFVYLPIYTEGDGMENLKKFFRHPLLPSRLEMSAAPLWKEASEIVKNPAFSCEMLRLYLAEGLIPLEAPGEGAATPARTSEPGVAASFGVSADSTGSGTSMSAEIPMPGGSAPTGTPVQGTPASGIGPPEVGTSASGIGLPGVGTLASGIGLPGVGTPASGIGPPGSGTPATGIGPPAAGTPADWNEPPAAEDGSQGIAGVLSAVRAVFRKDKEPGATRGPARRPEYFYLEYRERGEVRTIDLDKERTVIGRLPGQVDFIVDNKRVGKIHAEFYCAEGVCYVMDLDSRNGTYLNGSGQRIQSHTPYPLKCGDRVMLADSEFIVRTGR